MTYPLTERNQSTKRCNIPSKEQLLSATKENPIDWNAYDAMQIP